MYLEVYPDIIFILNFFVDLILLVILKKISRKISNLFRVVGAAAAGSLITVFVSVFPWMPLALRFILMYVIGSVLMIFIAFGRLKIMDFVKQVVCLYLITYFVGGLMSSVYYYTNFKLHLIKIGNGVVFSNVPIKFVVISILLVIPIVMMIFLVLRWHRNQSGYIYRVELHLENRNILTNGFMDTGNCLFDPIYKKPVMVIENSLVKELVSPQFYNDLEKIKHNMDHSDFDMNQWNLSKENILRLKFIPYHSIGKSGMMLGIKLDKVFVHTQQGTRCNEYVIAAISDNVLSTKEDYHVILHRELL